DALRIVRHHLFERRGGRHHGHIGTQPGELAQDVVLDAVIDHDRAERWLILRAVSLAQHPWRLAPSARLAARHVLCEIESFEAHEVLRRRDERGRVATAMRDRAMWHALLADT